MTDDHPQMLIDALDDLLEEERAALLAGELDRVARLAEQKEGLVETLNRLNDAPADRMGPVHGKLTRNQALLNSALEGIRAVAGRMAHIRKARRSLETYDQYGNKQSIVTPDAPKVEKRA
ncbi:flagellar biosynthesis protein FlgN [Thalassococcus sp. S3]|uniref:flagellar biosynthesis protein FlgN n=1 Tax=Thalassococcus sp. S3 TaxID=2017482 RepID=UPI001024087E|nr:flagellar biosynthesis protein FlgN [Thalassococcus sp. S3]QBF29714.1 flagellar biosynthesis protein FlgN [Thalassococcus sp. S3]